MKKIIFLVLMVGSLTVNAQIKVFQVNIAWEDSVVTQAKCNNKLACAAFDDKICFITAKTPEGFNDHATQEALGQAYMKCVEQYEVDNK